MFFFRAKCVSIFIEIVEIEIWGILGIQTVNPKYRGYGYNYSEGQQMKNPFLQPFDFPLRAVDLFDIPRKGQGSRKTKGKTDIIPLQNRSKSHP